MGRAEVIANMMLIESLHRANWRYCGRCCWRYRADSVDWICHPGLIPGCVPCIQTEGGVWNDLVHNWSHWND